MLAARLTYVALKEIIEIIFFTITFILYTVSLTLFIILLRPLKNSFISVDSTMPKTRNKIDQPMNLPLKKTKVDFFSRFAVFESLAFIL